MSRVGEDRLKSEAMKFAEWAAIQALENAKWDPKLDKDKFRTGVCIGNCMADLEFISASNQLLTT